VSKLRVLSGGAAQGLVNALAAQFEHDTGFAIKGEFSAVGRMKSKLRDGTPADVIILTEAVVGELTRDGYVLDGSAVDLGTVQTGIAVRNGGEAPLVDTTDSLRTALRAADEIFIPDAQQATAGIHFAKVLRMLGIWEEVEARLRPFPNGATAMQELAAATSARAIGCTQVTEIVNTPGVSLVGTLPPGCELATVYTAAVCQKAQYPDEARALIALLAGDSARQSRERAGFM
jgi:molybdate transport system substrate-binding protein